MPPSTLEQTPLRVGVDVGGTFTDLVAFDGVNLRVVKIPSSPPEFHFAVIDAVNRVAKGAEEIHMVHGSTVATNALLQRAGEPVAFITTDGFRDMLLIGRQNRPKLYALHVTRPSPITPPENWFTVRQRTDPAGNVIEPLLHEDVDLVIAQIRKQQLKHVAVCLLFSFANPEHERMIAHRCAQRGLMVSISSEILPEFREYERASTTAINASLRPIVENYLESLEAGLPSRVKNLQITQSAGGTLNVADAAKFAAKLVLSGPAGGVMGAAFAAREAGLRDVITYDMGGTSTDVATVIDGRPQWTTSSSIDGLPIGLPMYDIHTVGAGGGSIAHLDTGGALRVGPKSAGAAPGPACYVRGGTDATVTDANLVLGRILPDQFLGGAMKIDAALAQEAIAKLAGRMNKSEIETALGIVKVAEGNMASAIRAVTSRRGHDPQNFALVSFGGAGGLHACAMAESLEIDRVLVPPYCGVLSALGMVVAPPIVDAARTVVQLGSRLNDASLAAEYEQLENESGRALSNDLTHHIERFADVRFRGQSHELKIAVETMTLAGISSAFDAAYRTAFGRPPRGREVEIVTLRLRRIGRASQISLPRIEPSVPAHAVVREAELIDATGQLVPAAVLTRSQLLWAGKQPGPMLLVDAEATSFVPAGWRATAMENGGVMLERFEHAN